MNQPPVTIVVRVTEDHIRRGTPSESISCPIALALQEKLDDEFCSVGIETVITHLGYAELSKRARDFVFDFDSDGIAGVKPSTFRFTFR